MMTDKTATGAAFAMFSARRFVEAGVHLTLERIRAMAKGRKGERAKGEGDGTERNPSEILKPVSGLHPL